MAIAGGLLLRGAVMASSETVQDFHVCPKSRPPARTLYALRLEELTSYRWDLRLALTTLQGIVNRNQPRLYLTQDRYDELWLEWLKQRGDVDEVQWLEVGQVFERFLPEVSCVFVTDPAVPASINVATMLAAVHGGLVVTPGTAHQYHLPMGAPPDSSKVGMDLRAFHWKKDVEAYRWAYQEPGDQLSRQAIAYLDPYSIPLRDYLVEFKIPILWICSAEDAARNPQASPEEEYQFARDVLMKWPVNIPCMGWPGNSPNAETGIGEWPGVRLASQCGKFVSCTGYDGYSPAVSTSPCTQAPVPGCSKRRRLRWSCGGIECTLLLSVPTATGGTFNGITIASCSMKPSGPRLQSRGRSGPPQRTASRTSWTTTTSRHALETTS